MFAREGGRALCPFRTYSTVFAAQAVYMLGGDAARHRWLPDLAAGRCAATTALWNANDAADCTPALRADREPDGSWRLTGTADFVNDAETADLMVVSGMDASGRTFGFVANLRGPGVAVRPLTLMGGHAAACVRFDEVMVDDALNDGRPLDRDQLRRAANAAIALSSLDLVGVGEAVLDRTVAYTTMRHQFGRPIASFQAAQHIVADMHIALTAARLAARRRSSGSAAGTSPSAKPPSPACIPPRPRSGRRWTPTSCTAGWATSWRPICTCGPNAPGCCPRWAGSRRRGHLARRRRISRAAVTDRLRRKDGL